MTITQSELDQLKDAVLKNSVIARGLTKENRSSRK